MKRITLITAGLLFSAAAGSAFAADDGFYVAINVGQASTNTYNLSSKTATAYNGLVGYQFNKYFGAEVQYTGFGSITGQGGGSHDISGYGLNVVGTYPFNDQWSVFLRLGAADTTIKTVNNGSDVSRTDVTWGIGGQYNFTPNWGLRVDYDSYGVGSSSNIGTATTSLASLGVVYKF
ncbi:MAG: outer membrane beta-barrel protein [Gallionella sp.]